MDGTIYHQLALIQFVFQQCMFYISPLPIFDGVSCHLLCNNFNFYSSTITKAAFKRGIGEPGDQKKLLVQNVKNIYTHN